MTSGLEMQHLLTLAILTILQPACSNINVKSQATFLQCYPTLSP